MRFGNHRHETMTRHLQSKLDVVIGQFKNLKLIKNFKKEFYFEDIHVVFELLQLLHPLLNDVLDLRLSDHQDFLSKQHDNYAFSDHEVIVKVNL